MEDVITEITNFKKETCEEENHSTCEVKNKPMMSEEILGLDSRLSFSSNVSISVPFTSNNMDFNEECISTMENPAPNFNTDEPEQPDIKPEPMDCEPLELIPFVELVKSEIEYDNDSDMGQTEEQGLNPQQLQHQYDKPQTESQPQIEDQNKVNIKIKTEFDVTDERTELKKLEEQLREDIAESLNESGTIVKTEQPSDTLVEYDYPHFSMDSSDSGIHKTEIDTEISSEFMSYDGAQDTETNIITDKLINANSTITRPQEGATHQQTESGNDPQDIQPTHENSMLKPYIAEKTITEETYMLNSITSDMLPLEQYAIQRPFMCTQCPKTFRIKAYLVQHLRLHESLQYKDLKRKISMKKKSMMKDLVYKSKVKLGPDEVRKEKTEGQEYTCSCGKNYSRKTRVVACWRTHNEVFEEIPSFDCVTCKKGFSSEKELIKHNRNIHIRRKFPCKFCPAEFHERKQLVKHLTQHRKLQLAEYHVMSDIIKKKHKKIKCFICKESYPELLDLKVHVSSTHNNEINCIFCKKNMKYSDFFAHSKKKHNGSLQPIHELHKAYYELTRAWQCDECVIQFFKADEYAMHRVEKHSNSAIVKDSDQFQCQSCQRVFTSAKSLRSHVRVHDNIQEEAPKESNLICVYCRKVCTEETLESHMRFHSDERKYACRYCDYRFATSEKRKKHTSIHTGKLKFICFICEYRCSSEHRLQLHKMSSKHQSVKNHLLQGKAMPSQSSTRIEKVRDEDKNSKASSSEDSSDSDSDSNGIPCDICGDKFSTNTKMLAHKQTHPFIEFPNDDIPTRIFFK